MKIEIVNGKAIAQTPYNKAFIAAVKEIGGKWDGGRKTWTVSAERVEELTAIIRNVYGTDAEVVRYSAGIRRPTFADVKNAANTLPYIEYDILPGEALKIRLNAQEAVAQRIHVLAASSRNKAQASQVIGFYAFAEWIFSTKSAAWWNENAMKVDPKRGAKDPLLWMVHNFSEEFKEYVAANGGWAKKL